METKNRVAFDYDNEKAKLVKKSNLLEGSIEEDLDKIKDYFQENGQNALVIGGTLLGAYLLLRLLTSSGSDDEHFTTIPASTNPQPVVHMVREEQESVIVKQIKASITLFLISIAKQKLQEFIENYGKEKPKSE
jgi:predicted alpha/beta-fold hydrolase